MRFWEKILDELFARVENVLESVSPRDQVNGLSEVALAVAVFLQSKIAGKEEVRVLSGRHEFQIPRMLHAHQDLLREFIFFVYENMKYEVAYDRYVRGNPAYKMYETPYP